jgi:hypothetical protein
MRVWPEGGGLEHPGELGVAVEDVVAVDLGVSKLEGGEGMGHTLCSLGEGTDDCAECEQAGVDVLPLSCPVLF